MKSFDDHAWRTNKVTNRDDLPKGPHYQALVFNTRIEWTPSYGPPDPRNPTSETVPNVDVYVFEERTDLEKFIDQISRSDSSFVFYAVNALGKTTVTVKVDYEL